MNAFARKGVPHRNDKRFGALLHDLNRSPGLNKELGAGAHESLVQERGMCLLKLDNAEMQA